MLINQAVPIKAKAQPNDKNTKWKHIYIILVYKKLSWAWHENKTDKTERYFNISLWQRQMTN